jgi:hypothetical protein
VKPGLEDVAKLAFIDEHGELRLANGELAAVLNLHVLHRETPREYAILGLGPLDDIDELLGKEIPE